jgi:hypothetical protein
LFQLNVIDPENSNHIESCIPLRDLIAFGADNATDAKLLIHQCRFVPFP